MIGKTVSLTQFGCKYRVDVLRLDAGGIHGRYYAKRGNIWYLCVQGQTGCFAWNFITDLHVFKDKQKAQLQ